MSIGAKIEQLHASLPQGVKLVAVSKFHPVEALIKAYEAGQRIFGESRVQELLVKYEALPKDIEWQMIGHLQTNKVRQIVPFVKLIQSVDSARLLECINREAERIRARNGGCDPKAPFRVLCLRICGNGDGRSCGERRSLKRKV